MDHECLCYGRSWLPGPWYVKYKSGCVDVYQRLTESTKDFGDIPHRKSPLLIIGSAWPNTWTRTAFTASSSRTSWDSTMSTKTATRPCSQDRRFRFSMSVYLCQRWHTPRKTSRLASPHPRRTRTLMLLRGSLPRSIIFPMVGWVGTS
jgi:hypothetical protein